MMHPKAFDQDVSVISTVRQIGVASTEQNDVKGRPKLASEWAVDVVTLNIDANGRQAFLCENLTRRVASFLTWNRVVRMQREMA